MFRSVDSGIQVWNKDTLGDIQVVELKNIMGDFIVGSFEIPGKDSYWVTFSLDNVSLISNSSFCFSNIWVFRLLKSPI